MPDHNELWQSSGLEVKRAEADAGCSFANQLVMSGTEYSEDGV